LTRLTGWEGKEWVGGEVRMNDKNWSEEKHHEKECGEE
jgi:hypothetical protein